MPHGMSVILTAPAVFRWTASTDPGRHLEMAAAMGADTARRAGGGRRRVSRRSNHRAHARHGHAERSCGHRLYRGRCRSTRRGHRAATSRDEAVSASRDARGVARVVPGLDGAVVRRLPRFIALLSLVVLLRGAHAGRSAATDDRRGRESQLRADRDREAFERSAGRARRAGVRRIRDADAADSGWRAVRDVPGRRRGVSESAAAAGLTRDAGVVYAVGRLVIFAPTGSPLDGRRTARRARAAS